MAYKLLYGGQYLHDPYTGESVTDASLTAQTNNADYMDFTIHYGHSLYDTVAENAGIVELYWDKTKLFEGVIESIETDIEGSKAISCKGGLSYLEDTIVRAYSTVEGEQPVTAPSSPAGLFQWYIDQHNRFCDSKKRFNVGENQANMLDSNAYIYRSSSQNPTTWSEISSKLIDELGGYVEVQYTEPRTISYYADVHSTNAQIIDFGVNITDFSKTVDTAEQYTAIYAQGATPDAEGDETTYPIDLTGLPDGTTSYSSDFFKDGDHVYSVSGVARYGYREYAYSNTDCTTAEGLLESACKALSNLLSPDLSITVKAVDLALYMDGYDHLRAGQAVRVRSKFHGVDEYLMVSSINLDLNDPSQTTYELGASYQTLTGQQSTYLKNLNANTNKALDTATALSAETKAAAQEAKDAREQAATATATAETASSDASAAKEAASKAVVSTTTEYATNQDPATAPADGWSSEQPEWTAGNYIWMRQSVTYGDASTETTEPACITGNQGEQFQWNLIKGSEPSYDIKPGWNLREYQISNAESVSSIAALGDVTVTFDAKVNTGAMRVQGRFNQWVDSKSKEASDTLNVKVTTTEWASYSIHVTNIKPDDGATSLVLLVQTQTGTSDQLVSIRHVMVTPHESKTPWCTTQAETIGADGVSPTVTTKQTDTGATITITDATGTKTATVTNGQDADIEAAEAATTAANSAATSATDAAGKATTATTKANNAAAAASKVNATVSGTTLTVTDNTGKSASVDTKGEQGTDGASVSSVKMEYAQGDSSTTAPTSGWQDAVPDWQTGKYIWQRSVTTITAADGTATTQTGDAVLYGAFNSLATDVAGNASKITQTADALGVEFTDDGAVSTLIRETSEGIEVGKSEDGSTYTGTHTVVGTDAFSIHDKGHNELASFGANTVKLGENSTSSEIQLCKGTGSLVSLNGNIALSGENGSALHSNNGSAEDIQYANALVHAIPETPTTVRGATASLSTYVGDQRSSSGPKMATLQLTSAFGQESTLNINADGTAYTIPMSTFAGGQAVAQGTSGMWTYVKMANGAAACWGRHYYHLTQTGNYWWGELSLPFTFVKSDSDGEFACYLSGGSWAVGSLYSDYSQSLTQITAITAIRLASTNVLAETETYVFFLVIGRWK